MKEKENLDFDEHFIGQFNPVFNENSDSYLFETYGEEFDLVKSKIKDNLIWTVVDVDSNLYVIAGFHFVNRMGYIIAQVPYQDPIKEEEYIY